MSQSKENKKRYIPDFLPTNTIVEVVKYKLLTGEFVGIKVMTHGEFKLMEKQKGFRYQEFQKGYSQFN